jgi:hypothetical protein
MIFASTMTKNLSSSFLLAAVGCVLFCAVGCSDDKTKQSGDAGNDRGQATRDSGSHQHDAGNDSKDAGGTGSDSGSPGDAATGGSLPSGKGYSIVYVAGDNIGIDGRPDVEAKFDSTGMTYYFAADMEHLATRART